MVLVIERNKDFCMLCDVYKLLTANYVSCSQHLHDHCKNMAWLNLKRVLSNGTPTPFLAKISKAKGIDLSEILKEERKEKLE